jgi:hypothetical protein
MATPFLFLATPIIANACGMNYTTNENDVKGNFGDEKWAESKFIPLPTTVPLRF